MKTIIAPTDFSVGSLNAVNYAADMAVDTQACLLLLHIVELPATTVAELPVTEITYQELSREQEIINLKLDLLKRTNNAIIINTLHLLGNVQHDLKLVCDEIKPFAVVMCTHNPGVVDRFLFGSTTRFSARHINAPIINVPEGTVYQPVKTIAFASDLKDVFHIPVEEIKTITRAFNASLKIFFVQKTTAQRPDTETEKLLLINRLREFTPEFECINSADIESGIETFAREKNVDLVILVPHKHGWFHESTTEKVLVHLPLAAMTIPEN